MTISFEGVLEAAGWWQGRSDGVLHALSVMMEKASFFLNDPIFAEPNDASVQLTLENSATSRVLRQFDTLEASVGQNVMEGLNGYELAAVQLAMGKGRVTIKELGALALG